MTPYELLELFKDNYTEEEAIQMVNELLYELHSNYKKFTNGLEEEKDEFALSIGRCPLCTSRLVTKTYEEDRGEYQGFNCKEAIHITECSSPECSYTSM